MHGDDPSSGAPVTVEGAFHTLIVALRARRPGGRAPWGARRPIGDGRTETVTSGDQLGTDGDRRRQVFWMIYAAMSAFFVVNNLVNAMSVHTDLARLGKPVEDWEPYVWELTSAAPSIALVPLVAWLLKIAPPGPGRWLRFAAVHIPATAVYCLAHVTGFHILRHAAYLALGSRYTGYLDLLYEYPKDARSYLFVLGILWLGDQLALMWMRADQARATQQGPVFDIRDGATFIRAPVNDIVAVTSAGNYVEFHLADGRKPLMRTTLAAVDAQLKPHGLVRTHRSWLVNPLRVRGLTAEGSGDFRVELDGGAEAPLSRRFPKALETLRAPEVGA